MRVRILLFGSKGMLGQAIVESLKDDFYLIEASRAECDLEKSENIVPFIIRHKPNIVINSAAIIDIGLCEIEKESAFRVNSLAVASMVSACNLINAKLIQISTDHYYAGARNKQHSEDDPVTLLNVYAYTKFIGEAYALLSSNHLIIRTNIVGFKKNTSRKTFVSWAIELIEKREAFTLFNDYFASSIDIETFSVFLKKMILNDIKGLYNVGAADVISKAKFIELLSQGLSIPLNSPVYCSVNANNLGMTKRANSVGLDTSKIEKVLGVKMPTSQEVVTNILKVYNEIRK